MKGIFVLLLIIIGFASNAADVCLSTKECLIGNLICHYQIGGCPEVGESANNLKDMLKITKYYDYEISASFFSGEYILFEKYDNGYFNHYCLARPQSEKSSSRKYYEYMCSSNYRFKVIVPYNNYLLLDHMEDRGHEEMKRFKNGVILFRKI